MEMVGQNHDGIGHERVPSPRAYDGRAQGADVLGEEFRAPIRERGGKKKAAACNQISTVTNHLVRLPRISLP
ncbi:MAG: hypothetical protein WBD71_01055, partial [Xanthobacteraceae bacterium]